MQNGASYPFPSPKLPSLSSVQSHTSQQAEMLHRKDSADSVQSFPQLDHHLANLTGPFSRLEETRESQLAQRRGYRNCDHRAIVSGNVRSLTKAWRERGRTSGERLHVVACRGATAAFTSGADSEPRSRDSATCAREAVDEQRIVQVVVDEERAIAAD